MRLIDKHFKDALRDLPEKKLSWRADRRIKAMLRKRAAELDGKTSIWSWLRPMVAAPVAFALLVVSTGFYGVTSPSVVKGDLLYGMKLSYEEFQYPDGGTSEERIAYHLWLSDRRFDEVNEILGRLGKAPLTLIPAAQAQEFEADTELNLILLDTLDSATQHVDLAFLITNEIREVERVAQVKEQIRSSVQKQKVFLEKTSPVLKEVKLAQKQASRKLALRREQRLQERAISAQEDAFAQAEPAIIPVPEMSDDQEPEVVENQIIDPEELRRITSSVILPEYQEEDEELEDADELMTDRLAFHESLLEELDETVAMAEVKGEKEVEVEVEKAVEEVAKVEKPSDEKVFKKALVVHYGETQKKLELQIAMLEAPVVEEVVEEEETVVEEEEPVVEEESVVDEEPEVEEPEVVEEEPVVEEDPELIEEESEIIEEEPVVEEEPEEVMIAEVSEEVLEMDTAAEGSVEASSSLMMMAEDVDVAVDESLVDEVLIEEEVIREEPVVKDECQLAAEEKCEADSGECYEAAVKACYERQQKEAELREVEEKMIQLEAETSVESETTVETKTR